MKGKMPMKEGYERGGAAEMKMGMDEARSGMEAEEVEPFSVSLPYDDFPQLRSEPEGGHVMLLVMGEVKSKDGEQTTLEVNKASVIHGKMTPVQKKKVMHLEDALGHRPGVQNKYALARHIVLKKKKGGK